MPQCASGISRGQRVEEESEKGRGLSVDHLLIPHQAPSTSTAHDPAGPGADRRDPVLELLPDRGGDSLGRRLLERNRPGIDDSRTQNNPPITCIILVRSLMTGIEADVREINQKIGPLLDERERMAMMNLSEQSLSAFLSEEPDLYTLRDIRAVY
jgi:hypothetical protein